MILSKQSAAFEDEKEEFESTLAWNVNKNHRVVPMTFVPVHFPITNNRSEVRYYLDLIEANKKNATIEKNFPSIHRVNDTCRSDVKCWCVMGERNLSAIMLIVMGEVQKKRKKRKRKKNEERKLHLNAQSSSKKCQSADPIPGRRRGGDGFLVFPKY